MELKEWYDNKLKSFERDLDYILETVILQVTEKICRKMDEKGINRKKLAELLEVSPAAITKILNGNSNYTLKTLLSFASALELDLIVDFRDKVADPYKVVDISKAVSASSGTSTTGVSTTDAADFPREERERVEAI